MSRVWLSFNTRISHNIFKKYIQIAGLSRNFHKMWSLCYKLIQNALTLIQLFWRNQSVKSFLCHNHLFNFTDRITFWSTSRTGSCTTTGGGMCCWWWYMIEETHHNTPSFTFASLLLLETLWYASLNRYVEWQILCVYEK